MIAAANSSSSSPLIARQIRVRGLVQGVGFRPTVWRLAAEYQLTGQVINDGEGVLIDAVGSESQLYAFIDAITAECPPLARIDSIEAQVSENTGFTDFQIVKSKNTATHTGIVPDAATCSDCLRDTFDEKNTRRYRYPFTNCTHCGPRLSIVDAIPYDRANTSMASFKLCADCQAEYDDPADRRFHAQPNACKNCGPKVWLEPPVELNATDEIDKTGILLQQGKILAIKGISGFHLACDATNAAAVSRLRERKHRYAKPFALMARDIHVIEQYCSVNKNETQLLQSSAAPIVLLPQKENTGLPEEIAPGQKTLGFMLPYAPLHHILLQDFDFPIVMTSGNPSDSPQCITNAAAKTQLEDIADYWLMNDRDILNRIDDSVARWDQNEIRLLRRARGYAPATFPLPPGFEQAPDLLAFGGELKNTFCLLKDAQANLSQHMGDLENASTYDDYEKNLSLYQRLFEHQPTALAIDAHPEYLSSKRGRDASEDTALPVFEIQHHHAHIAACLAENNWPLHQGKVLGIVLDGLGYGADGTLWGGEFLLADYHGSQRLGSLKPVALLGGSQAMREPWRNTYAQLHSAITAEKLNADYGDLELVSFLSEKPVATLDAMMAKGINAPLASSCGRLFDAVAAALNICRDKAQYEGQAAIELEALIDQQTLAAEKHSAYPFWIKLQENNLLQIDPEPFWIALLDDLKEKIENRIIAARFHTGLAAIISTLAIHLLAANNNSNITKTVLLSGGVFQNRILFGLVTEYLTDAGYQVLSHTKVPANDGGIALGQATIAAAKLINELEMSSCA